MKSMIAAGLILTALVAAPARVAAQVPADPQDARDGWKTDWFLSLQSAYDHNPFRLTPGQRRDLGDEDPRYHDMTSPYDFVHTVKAGGEWRGPGLGGRTLRFGVDARGEVYTRSPRQSSVRVGSSVEQQISKGQRLGVSVAFTPAEFRRNYLAGTDALGQPDYEAGIAHTLDGKVSYGRELLRGKGAQPEVDLTLAGRAARRIYPDFAWRDRTELGGQIGLEFDFGAVNLELRGARLRGTHGGEPEPIASDLGVVTTMALDRDYDQTELGIEARTRVARRIRLDLSYERRHRGYLASLAEDDVYGDREDKRDSVGAELRFGRKRMAFLVGGGLERQTTFRPGRGDTGDEDDFTRVVTHVGLEYRR